MRDGQAGRPDASAGSPGIHPGLNFNSIAQGYTCDKIAGYLHSLGVKDMLVNIGEIYCEGVNPSGKPWTIGVDMPEDETWSLAALALWEYGRAMAAGVAWSHPATTESFTSRTVGNIHTPWILARATLSAILS